MSTEPPNILLFKSWLCNHQGSFNSNVQFRAVPSGFLVIAKDEVPPDTDIVTCPFSLAVTKTLAKEALLNIFNISDTSRIDSWTERQCIATYLCFHSILGEESSPSLQHHPYVNILPSIDQLRTGLHFTPEEREMFKGSNLYGAIHDREKDWQKEWDQCRTIVSGVNAEWGRVFTWELFLTGATHISSRAFPSTLLSRNPSLKATPSTEPVLLPGIDSLNHARAQPVSWVVKYPKESTNSSEPCISLVLHNSTASGAELFNNYGLKPNSELILGYGFSLAENPDDTILLKIGGAGSDTKKWEVGRSASGADGLWTEILSLVKQDRGSEPTYEDELDASSMLNDMVRQLIERLPPTKRTFDPAQIRPDVVEMYQNYIEGQRDILDSLLEFADNKEHVAIEKAREQGIDLSFEDDE